MSGIINPIPLSNSKMKIPSRPSIFEIFAYSSMSSTGLPALSYLLGKLLISKPNSKLLQYLSKNVDWLFFGIRLLVENHWIYQHGASFAESFYHLTRVTSNGTPSLSKYRKSRLKRLTFLFFAVVMPFLKSQMDSLFTSIQSQDEDSEEEYNPSQSTSPQNSSLEEEEEEEEENSPLLPNRRVRRFFSYISQKIDKSIKKMADTPIKGWFKLFYPYFHFLYSATSLICFVLYSYNIIDFPFFSLFLQGISLSRINSSLFHQLRTIKRRLSFENLLLNVTLLSAWTPRLPLPRLISTVLQSQSWELQNQQVTHWTLRFPPLAGMYGWIRSWYTQLLGSQNSPGSSGARLVFPLFLFLFKLLEWWNASPSINSLNPTTPPSTQDTLFESEGQRSELLGVDSIDIPPSGSGDETTNISATATSSISIPSTSSKRINTAPISINDALNIRRRLLHINSLLYNLKYNVNVCPPPIPETNKKQVKSNQCPLCNNEFASPTLLVSSGYVYCYSCIHQYLNTQGTCPVTGIPASLDHLRSVYDSSGS